MYALSSAQMRALEDRCAEAGIRGFTLMENAGRAAALAINGTIPVKGKKCVVFCGSGNNGGDGFIVAAELKKLGAEVQVILCFDLPKGRTAREAYEKAYAAEVPMVDLAISPYGCELAMSGVDIVVDAIFGTGFHGELGKGCLQDDQFRHRRGICAGSAQRRGNRQLPVGCRLRPGGFYRGV